jgi:hypothetical protein
MVPVFVLLTFATMNAAKYAVLVDNHSGGYYKTDLKHVYRVLKNDYGYTDSDIYVLYHNTGAWLDLDGDGSNDVDYKCSQVNFDTVIDILDSLTADGDVLFIYATGHGQQGNGDTVAAKFYGDGSDDVLLYDYELREAVDDLEDKDTYSIHLDKILVLQQCYSGGFIDDFDDSLMTNVSVTTACKKNEASYHCPDDTPDDCIGNEFTYWWSQAFHENPWCQDSGQYVTDANGDGIVSLWEGYSFAEEADRMDGTSNPCSNTGIENPQYFANSCTWGHFVTLDGSGPTDPKPFVVVGDPCDPFPYPCHYGYPIDNCYPGLHGPDFWRDTETYFVHVLNKGNAMTVPGYVKVMYADPTLDLSASNPYFLPVDSLPLPPMAPGDTSIIGPFTFSTFAPNVFGEPYWTIFAVAESPESELETGMIYQDYHVAAENVWVSEGEVMAPHEVHFYARNPLPDSAKLNVRVDDSDLPPSWAYFLSPSCSETLLVGPYESVPVELIVTPFTTDTGVIYVNETICHPDIEPCTHCEDTCGGCYGWTGGCAFVVTPLPVRTMEDSNQPFGGQIGLLQVRPNPFTGKTEISFAMSGRADVDVTIFDPSGRRVRTLHKGLLETGDVRLSWDGRDDAEHSVRPGHYFVLVETSDRTTAKKITLLK